MNNQEKIELLQSMTAKEMMSFSREKLKRNEWSWKQYRQAWKEFELYHPELRNIRSHNDVDVVDIEKEIKASQKSTQSEKHGVHDRHDKILND